MKWKMINTPLGLSHPYGVSSKLQSVGSSGSSGSSGAAAASVFDNFIGGMFGMAVNDMNNAMNHRIAEETNQANREINEQQIAYAREQYEKEKAENRYLVDQAYQRSSPMAQKARYIAAGINPHLAMSGSGGSAGSAGVSVGSPAKGSQPSVIPMQTGAPMQAFNPLPDGLGISEAMGLSIAQKEQNLKERAFEHDLSVAENKMEMEWFDYLDRHAKSSADIREIDARIDDMRKTFAFEKDKFEKQIEWQNFQQYVEQYQLQQRDFELNLQQISIESGVQVNSAMASKLFAEKKNFEESARQMVMNGFTQRELNRALERKENAIADGLILDYEQDHGQLDFENRNKLFKAYKRVANAVLQPIRGIVSAGANVATKIK